jgi:DNA-binding HxlR family transcriptional regulator
MIVPTRRSYGDACAIARALDVVGERWALLVVRELLLAPQRFSELRRALPNASSNLVADRLRELEERGVIHRRKLPPPGNASVYELTEWGRGLEPIVLALGGWGLRIPLPDGPTTLSATSALLFMRGVARPDPEARPTTCRLELDEYAWTLETIDGRLEIRAGEPATADCSLATDPQTLVALLEDPRGLEAAVSEASARIGGSKAAVRRLLRGASTPPGPRPARRGRDGWGPHPGGRKAALSS